MASMGGGQDEYYSNLAREDYYTSGGEPPGQWFGRGAKELGLTGKVNAEAFSEIFGGYLEGRALTQNAGSDRRCSGWDLTFSAPKSVSVAFGLADELHSQEIRAAHQEAVEKALSYMEEAAGWTRRGKKGLHFEKAGVVIATFEHGTNRNQEPNLHTHSVTMNVSVREDGTTGTIYARPMFQHKMAVGAIYRTELAYQLERRLGLVSETDGRSFKLSGVDPKVCEEFSSRSKELRELAEKLGFEDPSPERLAQLAVTSRKHKEHEPREKLQAKWKGRAAELGWGQAEFQELVSPQGIGERPDRDVAAKLAFSTALSNLTWNQSTFTEKDLVRFVAEQAQTQAIGADLVFETVRQELRRSPELVSLGRQDGEVRYTTQEILDLEQEMLARVECLKERSFIGVADKAVQTATESRPTINKGQLEMLRYLTQGEGAIKTIVGDAGTGKTYALEAVKEALQDQGYKVKGAALAGAAAEELGKTGIDSRTIESLLWYLENRPGPGGRSILDSKTMLVVDEAGMVDTRRMAELVRHVDEAGATLVLVGDNKQIQAVEQGGAFAKIHEEVKGGRLSEILRQKSPEDRDAVKAISEGRAADFLSHVANKGHLNVLENKLNAREQLVRDWMEYGSMAPKENLIFCGTNADVAKINREIQIQRIVRGELSVEASNQKNRDGSIAERFHGGDRVIFKAQNKGLGIKNGNQGTVISVSERLGFITVELDKDAAPRTISLSEFGPTKLKLGYAITAHAAQGATVENGYFLTDEFMSDKELTYVQASRAKLDTFVYTTEIEAGENLTDLAKTMQRSREKELAVVQAKKFEPDTSQNQGASYSSQNFGLDY